MLISGIYSKSKSAAKKIVSIPKKIVGILMEYQVNKSKKSIIFTDWLGFKYWQYPGDKIKFNWYRKSVLDSKGVIQYILSNVRKGEICIDIGAAIGAVSIPLWSKVGMSGKVFSVEADPRKINKIKANLALNNFPLSYILNVAVADNEGIRNLRCYPEASGWNTFGNPSFAKGYDSYLVDVETISFNRMAENYNLGSIDLVKIDTEGAEILILFGMYNFLQAKKIRQVIFEVNYLMLEGMNSTVDELMHFWHDLDYDLWRIDENGHLIEIKEYWPSNLVGDCVAISRG